MKRLLHLVLTLVLGSLLPISVMADTLPLVGNVLARKTTSLNGEWNYIVDVQEEGYYDYRMNPTSWGFFRNAKPQRPEDLIEYDFDTSPTMPIPSDWNTRDERLFFYEGTVWFKKSFDWHPTEGRNTLLYFGAVNYDCHVYVNGTKVGHHIGGFTPFNFDVTQQLKDGENTVIVKVDNKRHAEDVPTQIFDWWNYGGITRDVLLVNVAPLYIENYSLQIQKPFQKKGDKLTPQQQLQFEVKLNKAEAGQQVTLSIPELKINKTLTTDAEGKAAWNFAAKPLLWSPENPKLYRVNLTLNGEILTDDIGFRTIETRDKEILLNGKPIFLKGISIHEEKPNGGGRAIKEAERMGILVWSEIPVYWTIAWTNTQTFENAQAQLRDMIARDKNRANIIIWSIANETPHSPQRDSFLSRLSQYARTQDNTRLISMAMEVTGASNYVNRLNDNMNQYVDVVSFNQYIGWYRDVNDAPKMKWEIPYNKPVIISEFGGGAKAGYHGEKNQRWTEEFQENLYRENIAMIDKIEGLAGTTPWILKDFRSPRRVLPDTTTAKVSSATTVRRKKHFMCCRNGIKESSK